MELSALIAEAPGKAIPVQPVKAEELDLAIAGLDARERRFVTAQGFKAEAGRHVVIPDAEGNIGRVLFGLGGADTAERGPLALGKLATVLPPGVYRARRGCGRSCAWPRSPLRSASYRFDRYRKPRKEGRAAGCSRRRRRRSARPDPRRRLSDARPHQHAGERPVAARPRARGVRARRPLRSQHLGHRGRGARRAASR